MKIEEYEIYEALGPAIDFLMSVYKTHPNTGVRLNAESHAEKQQKDIPGIIKEFLQNYSHDSELKIIFVGGHPFAHFDYNELKNDIVLLENFKQRVYCSMNLCDIRINGMFFW